MSSGLVHNAKLSNLVAKYFLWLLNSYKSNKEMHKKGKKKSLFCESIFSSLSFSLCQGQGLPAGLYTVCTVNCVKSTIKVHIFWEGHIFLRNLHRSNLRSRFRKILLPSQNIWTIKIKTFVFMVEPVLFNVTVNVFCDLWNNMIEQLINLISYIT